MRVALIGTGKTGGKVKELLPSEDVVCFNSKNPVTVKALQQCDVAICFIPGKPFIEMAPILIEAKIPVVTGSTGIEISTLIEEKVKSENLKWIHGHNFALGMNLIYQMIKVLSGADKLFDQKSFHIHEVHHTGKIDGPSGTAISWGDWLGQQCSMSFERIGDVVGEHSLKLKTDSEVIELKHSALDRNIFAKGAIWAAKKLLTDPEIPMGINKFEDIARKELSCN